MTSLYSQFKADPKLESEGIYLEYGVNSKKEPIQIRIARAGGANTRYAKRLEIITKPYRRQIQTESIDRDQLTALLKQAYAETVVLGWTGVEDEDGNDLPFNVANCRKLFDDLPDLFQDVMEQAQKSALFRAELKEADAGN